MKKILMIMMLVVMANINVKSQTTRFANGMHNVFRSGTLYSLPVGVIGTTLKIVDNKISIANEDGKMTIVLHSLEYSDNRKDVFSATVRYGKFVDKYSKIEMYYNSNACSLFVTTSDGMTIYAFGNELKH